MDEIIYYKTSGWLQSIYIVGISLIRGIIVNLLEFSLIALMAIVLATVKVFSYDIWKWIKDKFNKLRGKV